MPAVLTSLIMTVLSFFYSLVRTKSVCDKKIMFYISRYLKVYHLQHQQVVETTANNGLPRVKDSVVRISYAPIVWGNANQFTICIEIAKCNIERKVVKDQTKQEVLRMDQTKSRDFQTEHLFFGRARLAGLLATFALNFAAAAASSIVI